MGKNSLSWGLIIFGLLALAVIGSFAQFFQDSFSLSNPVALLVGLKFSVFVVLIGLLSLAFNSIFTILFTIAIPTSIFWYRPILNEKALQVFEKTLEMPFYGTNNGQIIISLVIALASYGFWIYKKYK
ncbi:TPA: hypothetical protein ACNICG_003445 [Acinetobacter baumannii]